MSRNMRAKLRLYPAIVILTVTILGTSVIVSSFSKTSVKTTRASAELTQPVGNNKPSPTGLTIAPTLVNNPSGSASSSGASTLQPATPSPATSGITYPCSNCPEATYTTDIKICADYCPSPAPQPSPTPDPGCYCRGNLETGEPVRQMCPMIACRLAE